MKLPLSDVVSQAEPLLARILMTLDADYVEIQVRTMSGLVLKHLNQAAAFGANSQIRSKLPEVFLSCFQEPLLSVLCQVLKGKSFELILAVATVEGKLRTFVSKLIKFNEGSKQVGGVVGKAAQTRAMLFDITFLMLCLIVQMYGSDVSVKADIKHILYNYESCIEIDFVVSIHFQVVLSEQGGNSFFEQWVRDCMVERRQPKSPDQMLKNFNSNRVSELLSQFNSGDCEFSTRFVCGPREKDQYFI